MIKAKQFLIKKYNLIKMKSMILLLDLKMKFMKSKGRKTSCIKKWKNQLILLLNSNCKQEI